MECSFYSHLCGQIGDKKSLKWSFNVIIILRIVNFSWKKKEEKRSGEMCSETNTEWL